MLEREKKTRQILNQLEGTTGKETHGCMEVCCVNSFQAAKMLCCERCGFIGHEGIVEETKEGVFCTLHEP